MGSSASSLFDDEETARRKKAEAEKLAKEREQQAQELAIINRPSDEQSKLMVRQCWQEISQQVQQMGEQQTGQNGSAEEPSDTIRIFVSSTFTDFNSERDILVKQVFPSFRGWLRKRCMDLVDIDLRWGVPVTATASDTVNICLGELDMCMQTNGGKPFFVGLVGERYGWIPKVDELPDDLREKYSWVPNCSITHQEILHGAFRTKNPNACFFIRAPNVIPKVPEEFQHMFIERDPLASEHLRILKTALKQRFPDQVFDYRAEYDSVINATGRGRVHLEGLATFGQQVLDFLKAATNREYPTRIIGTLYDEESIFQTWYLWNQIGALVGRLTEVNVFVDHINGSTEFGRDRKAGSSDNFGTCKWSVENGGIPPICVIGQDGIGKTSFLAILANECIKQEWKTFYHFCGAQEASRVVKILLKRLCKFAGISDEEIKEKDEAHMVEICKNQALPALEEIDDDLLIIIDAVEELEGSNDSDHYLCWLPPFFPENVTCIISCPVFGATIESKSAYKFELENLTKGDQKLVMKKLLGKHSKVLDDQQYEELLAKPRTPFWLGLASEELRMFGDFRTLGQYISSLPYSDDGLMGQVLKRIITEDLRRIFDDPDYERDKIYCWTWKLLLILTASFEDNGLPASHILFNMQKALRSARKSRNSNLADEYGRLPNRQDLVFLQGALEPFITIVDDKHETHKLSSYNVYRYLTKNEFSEDQIEEMHRWIADNYEFNMPILADDREGNMICAHKLPFHLTKEGTKLAKQRMSRFIWKNKGFPGIEKKYLAFARCLNNANAKARLCGTCAERECGDKCAVCGNKYTVAGGQVCSSHNNDCVNCGEPVTGTRESEAKLCKACSGSPKCCVIDGADAARQILSDYKDAEATRILVY